VLLGVLKAGCVAVNTNPLYTSSEMAHQALPYEGQLDRVVVSFNASLHAARGSDRLHGYSAA